MEESFFDSMLNQSNSLLSYSLENNDYANLMLSIPNIFFVFSMLQMGADKNTLKQLSAFLGTDRLPKMTNGKCDYELGSANGDPSNGELVLFLNYLFKNGENDLGWGKLKADSKIYAPPSKSSGSNINQAFNDCCNSIFKSQLEVIDFTNTDKSIESINKWVSESTNGKINKLLSPGSNDLSSDTKLLLISVLYFKYNWMYPFDPKFTKKDKFHKNDESFKMVDFMKQKLRVSTLNSTKFRMAALPYQFKGKPVLYGIFVIPTIGVSIEEMLTSNENDKIHFESYFKDLVSSKATGSSEFTTTFTEVELKIPKFKFSSKMSLNKYLSTVGGLSDLFDESKADLSKITVDQQPLYVSNVIHSTFIDVNEVGTEAAASTAIQITPMSFNPDGPIIFHVDHPFLFYVYSSEIGVPLFSSYISDPSV